jgi:biotin synthase
MSDTKELLKKVHDSDYPDPADIERLLAADSHKEIGEIFDFADSVRENNVGDGVLLRGIVEFSNYCRNSCLYCGINSANSNLIRYRMPIGEIMAAVETIALSGIKTVVLQSGEDDGLDVSRLSGLIRRIKSGFDIRVTLSVGERSMEEYRAWKEAGADRFLLKIETTDENIYASLHPGMSLKNRIECLKNLKDLGYETGSGNIIGLRGQTPESIARDILFFKDMGIDMIGIGPFMPHQETLLSKESPGDLEMTLKTIALTRIVTKDTNIPATTAIGSMKRDCRADALKAGANVLMPNFTPRPYKQLYDIYTGRRCSDEPQGACNGCMERIVSSIGRKIDYSKGDRQCTLHRQVTACI